MKKDNKDKVIEVYGFDSVPEFKNAIEKWNFWEAQADKKFGKKPSEEKANWVSSKLNQ